MIISSRNKHILKLEYYYAVQQSNVLSTCSLLEALSKAVLAYQYLWQLRESYGMSSKRQVHAWEWLHMLVLDIHVLKIAFFRFYLDNRLQCMLATLCNYNHMEDYIYYNVGAQLHRACMEWHMHIAVCSVCIYINILLTNFVYNIIYLVVHSFCCRA